MKKLQPFSLIILKLSVKLTDQKWLEKIAYLCDIYTYLNETNISMQGTALTLFKVQSKINALHGKQTLG